MEITSAEFVISNTDVKKCPAGIFPEYAFIGRSNVGKSSLINMLTSRKGLAMTSSTSEKNECCITFPNESTTATTAAALNSGMKHAVSVKRFAFTTGVSTSASTRASKSAPNPTSCCSC